jgi:hypothetical protein
MLRDTAAPQPSLAASLQLIPSAQLVPDTWQDLCAGPVWAFNPSLLRHGPGFVLAYRLVGADGRRRIGLCRLSNAFTVLPGSAVAYSDEIAFAPGSLVGEQARSWFADPRLFRLGDGVFIYWNSGWHEPGNAQFIQQIDVDSLRPAGPPRELVLDGERRAIEKNWMLFESGGDCHAVYSINPHRILRFSLQGSDAIVCTPVAATAWVDDCYQPGWGELRGGTPPQRVDNCFHSFCHSVHGPSGAYVYSAAAYSFSAEFPFAPVQVPMRPLAIAVPAQLHSSSQERLNKVVREVVYPAGAVFDQGQWIVSLGVNDQYCALLRISGADLAAHQRRV